MTNELTVRVQSPVIPAMSWNEEEVQRNLDEMLAAYTGRVYTPESIKGAKEDRAKVNAWVPFLLLTRRDVLLSIPPKLLLSTSRRPRNAKAVLISRPRVCPKIAARS